MHFLVPLILAALTVADAAAVWYTVQRCVHKTRRDMEQALSVEREALLTTTERKREATKALEAIVQGIAEPAHAMSRALDHVHASEDATVVKLVEASARVGKVLTLASELLHSERSDEHPMIKPANLHKILAQAEGHSRVGLHLQFPPEEVVVQIPPGAVSKALGRLFACVRDGIHAEELRVIVQKSQHSARLDVYALEEGSSCMIQPMETLEVLAARRALERAGGQMAWGDGAGALVLSIKLPLSSSSEMPHSGPLQVIEMQA